MDFDPEATLRCWVIDVDVEGATYTIPALPAADWLLAVALGSYRDIFPGLLEDPTVLDDQLVEGLLVDECVAAARVAIAEAAGCPWWTAARLAHGIASTWIGGEFTLLGVDPGRVSFGAYLAAAYRAVTRDMEEAKRTALDMELLAPPEGVPIEDVWDEDAAADTFMAALGSYRE